MPATKAFIVAGVSSGSGKTTISSAVIYALKAMGYKVQPFKVGPDYIDPAHLSFLAERPCRSLDVWMMGEDGVKDNFYRGIEGADIAVIEGVGGIYDGLSSGELASTAQIAKILKVPVVLVMDVWGISRTAAAIIKGIREFDNIDVRGVIFNFVGSEGHYRLLTDIVKSHYPDIEVLGGVVRDKKFSLPERHLGIKQALEIDWESRMEVLKEVASWIDVTKLMEIAESFKWEGSFKNKSKKISAKLAVAYDKAFSFLYHETKEAFEEEGVGISYFSPLKDRIPQDCKALLLPGGYPELFYKELVSNTKFLKDLGNFLSKGYPVYAECGGLIFLCMMGFLPMEVNFKNRPFLGYAEGKALGSHPFLEEGKRVKGHMFHYSEVIEKKQMVKSYEIFVPSKGMRFLEGYTFDSVFATYLHLNLYYARDFLHGFLSKIP